MDGWMDGWMDGRTDGRMDGLTDRAIGRLYEWGGGRSDYRRIPHATPGCCTLPL